MIADRPPIKAFHRALSHNDVEKAMVNTSTVAFKGVSHGASPFILQKIDEPPHKGPNYIEVGIRTSYKKRAGR